MRRTRVGIAKASRDDVLAGVRKAVSLAGGLEELVRPDSKVLVKPNYHCPAPPGVGLVTDARVVEAVTRLVMELGPRSVIIGEGSGAGYDFPGHSTEESFKASGVDEVARRLGVELRNLNSDDFEEVQSSNALVMDTVKIARTALESDVIISIPVLKSHIRTHVTLSVKNMKGVMPGNEKRKSHLLGLDMAIVDLNSVVTPSYAVVDAITGMEGLWQYPEDSKEMGLVLAGREALAVDLAGSSLMGIDPGQVMHLKYMAERKGVEAGLEQIEVAGERLEQHRQRFKTGFEVFQSRYPQVRMVSGKGACSGCTGNLVSAITYLKKAGFEAQMEGLTVVIGEPEETDFGDKVAVLGKCARHVSSHGTFVAGCPPSEQAMIEALCEACGAQAEHVLAVRDETRRELWKSSDEALKK